MTECITLSLLYDCTTIQHCYTTLRSYDTKTVQPYGTTALGIYFTGPNVPIFGEANFQANMIGNGLV